MYVSLRSYSMNPIGLQIKYPCISLIPIELSSISCCTSSTHSMISLISISLQNIFRCFNIFNSMLPIAFSCAPLLGLGLSNLYFNSYILYLVSNSIHLLLKLISSSDILTLLISSFSMFSLHTSLSMKQSSDISSTILSSTLLPSIIPMILSPLSA